MRKLAVAQETKRQSRHSEKCRSTPLSWCRSTSVQEDGSDLFQADSSPKFSHITRLLLVGFIPNIYSFWYCLPKTHILQTTLHIFTELLVLVVFGEKIKDSFRHLY